MKITFIRHGHSESNEKNIFSSDVADEFYLTNTGIGQIKQTADEFRPSAHEKVYIYASPMKRTVHSAEIYIKYANLKEPVLQDTRIKEIDYGKYAGHPAEGDAQEKIDAAYAQIKAGNNDVRVGETGETSREFLARNYEFFEEIIKKHGVEKDAHVLVFSHAGPIRAMENLILGSGGARPRIKNGEYHTHVITGDLLSVVRDNLRRLT